MNAQTEKSEHRSIANRRIHEVARRQSAIDLNCDPDDFLSDENRLVLSAPHPQARRYLSLPFECNLVSYGNNIVASVNEETQEIVKTYITAYPAAHCFETPNLHVRGALEIGSRCLLYGGILSAGPEQSERTSLQI